MQIFIPYINLQDATLISLIGYDYTPVDLLKTKRGAWLELQYGYSSYFKDRWDKSETFINIEHDVVVYPGALEALWDCPQQWCAYNYHLPVHKLENLEEERVNVPTGCMKISKTMIEKTKGLWDEPILWDRCDKHLSSTGLQVHQHFPSVVNANPALMGMVK